MDDPESLDQLFRETVAAIDAGDLASLERLLAAHPRLVRDRLDSPGGWLREQVGQALEGFFRAPYLLWFVAEDPVRSGKLPGNIAQMALAIIQAARLEGVQSLQEQLDYTLHLAVCSPVGREDGLQVELIDVLVDAGASTSGAPDQALICRNAAAAEHLLERGAELTLPSAACLARWDDVRRLGREASATDKQTALALNALNGKAQALRALLDLGVDLNAYSTGFYTHATPLHHAVNSGSLDAVKVLVEAGADLRTKDLAWHSTPLGWAEHARKELQGDEHASRYAEISAYLLEKGAP